jgi:hypothetical protein
VSQFHLLGDPGDELATPPVLAWNCLYVNGRDFGRGHSTIAVKPWSAS